MVELNCDDCGGDRFSYPVSVQDSASIQCMDCGRSMGSFEELKERIAADVARHRAESSVSSIQPARRLTTS